MKIKRLNSIRINSFTFDIKWDKKHNGGSFSYGKNEIEIGVKGGKVDEMFMVICHEIMEICTIEMNVRLQRPDCESDYIFVYDHRQHETLMNMHSSLIAQFIV